MPFSLPDMSVKHLLISPTRLCLQPRFVILKAPLRLFRVISRHAAAFDAVTPAGIRRLLKAADATPRAAAPHCRLWRYRLRRLMPRCYEGTEQLLHDGSMCSSHARRAPLRRLRRFSHRRYSI